MAKRKASVQIKECVACGTCVKVCPVGAISVYKGLYADVLRLVPRRSLKCRR